MVKLVHLAHFGERTHLQEHENKAHTKTFDSQKNEKVLREQVNIVPVGRYFIIVTPVPGSSTMTLDAIVAFVILLEQGRYKSTDTLRTAFMKASTC